MHGVRALEERLAQGAQEIPITIEHDHRMPAAIEHINPVLRVDADAADIAVIPTVRQLPPPRLYAVGKVADSDGHAHCISPYRYAVRRRMTCGRPLASRL